jgi:hypothetical protein
MGSRTEWIIKGDDSGSAVHLYSHWGGEDKFADTQRAIAKAMPRWSDTTYGVRIFISQIIGNEWDSETGFGIAVGNDSDNLFEESYFHAVIDFPNQRVVFGSREWSFAEFISADNIQEELVNEYYGIGEED